MDRAYKVLTAGAGVTKIFSSFELPREADFPTLPQWMPATSGRRAGEACGGGPHTAARVQGRGFV